jgi:hypothetical protein
MSEGKLKWRYWFFDDDSPREVWCTVGMSAATVAEQVALIGFENDLGYETVEVKLEDSDGKITEWTVDIEREVNAYAHEVERLTDEQMDALARSTASPDLFGGDWSEELHRRVYTPLIRAGLVVQTTKPYPPDPNSELVHYEATEAGRELVRRRAI